MKQINFKEINSKNHVKGTLQGGSQSKTQKTKIATTKIQNPVNKSAQPSVSYNSLHKKKHQTYQEAFDELNKYINKVKVFTYSYINQNKKEKGFFDRILSKLLRIDEDEREEWIEVVAETPQIERWMDKIENLVDFIDDFYNKDLTYYVESELGNLFPDYY